MAKKTLVQRFDEDFVRELKQARNNPEAFERATEAFERDHGFTPFENHDAWRMAKYRARKKKKL